MLDFIGSVFKRVISVIIAIALIAVLIGGFVVMSNSFLPGLLVWVGGFIAIVLFFGMLSIFVEINDNIKILISKTGNTSSGNTYESIPRVAVASLLKKKCSKCKKEVNEDNSKCPYCGNDTFE